jgi:hypothetical protein
MKNPYLITLALGAMVGGTVGLMPLDNPLVWPVALLFGISLSAWSLVVLSDIARSNREDYERTAETKAPQPPLAPEEEETRPMHSYSPNEWKRFQ